MRKFLLVLWFLLLVPLVSGQSGEAGPALFCAESPFNQPIPADAEWIAEERIGTFRQNQTRWSVPVYRIAAGEQYPEVEIINDYSGRVEHWQIPPFAQPASASDRHMAIINHNTNTVYEFWDARWQDADTIHAGGMKDFPLDGAGISDPPTRRVTAAGFAVTAGMILREDFTLLPDGRLSPDLNINHALTISLNFDIVIQDGYESPAVGGEENGRAGADGIPMGARFALPAALTESDLHQFHPFTRALALAARDYGIFINDTNSAEPYHDRYVGNLRVEPGVIEEAYDLSNTVMMLIVQREMEQIIRQYGIYRIVHEGPDMPVCIRQG